MYSSTVRFVFSFCFSPAFFSANLKQKQRVVVNFFGSLAISRRHAVGFRQKIAGTPLSLPDLHAKILKVVKQIGFPKSIVSNKIGFPLVFEGFGALRKLREACGKNFHLISCQSTSVVTSYDQKTKNWRRLKQRLLTCQSKSSRTSTSLRRVSVKRIRLR